MTYRDRLRAILSPTERKLFAKLSTPQKIQNHLDSLPINFERKGETYMSPRRVIRAKTAHCFEGALFAAAALAYHGERPLLLDLRTAPSDEDHVVALFRQRGRWGAISKTNHPILRFREPVYLSPRELAMSYFHEYIDQWGRKSLRAFSAPYDLSQYDPNEWVTEEDELFWLVNALDDSRHYAVAPKGNLKLLRHAYEVERDAIEMTEWTRDGRRK